jgi:hypothetical protein
MRLISCRAGLNFGIPLAYQGVCVRKWGAKEDWKDELDAGSRIESDSEAGEEVLRCDT